MNLEQILQYVGPAVAVYAAIRVDIALLKYRMTAVEKKLPA